MTTFDLIVKFGPKVLADVLTDMAVQAVIKVYSMHLGIDIEIPDDIRNEIREDYYTSLTKEFGEV